MKDLKDIVKIMFKCGGRKEVFLAEDKMITDFFKLSLNSLKKRKLRSSLTMLGIIIGISAVVSLISLGNGLQQAITGQFDTLSADKLTIQNAGTGFGPPGSTVIKKLNSHDLDIIKRVAGVQEVVPRLIRVAKVEFNKNVNYVYLADVPKEKNLQKIIYDSANVEISEGRLIETGDKGKVIIGSEIAKESLFEKQIEVGKNILIQGQSFQVIGILKPSSSFQINNVILMPTEDMKEILKIGDEIDLIVAQVDENNAETIAEKIKQDLRRDRGEKVGEETFSVQTPLQAISSVNTILNIINLIVTGIAAISLIIGGIGIANTMYTSVLERKKEIGTMKAIGARNSDIRLLFVLESGTLGLIGGVIGALLGLGMALAVSGIANSAFGQTILSVQVNYTLLIGAILFSFVIGLLSGWFPAKQASKLRPVDALRG